ncbi:MAG TPA: aminotransferase class V-fold PLP-dependent enzyme [Steroidobacteraceae bacterium]|nr:aminotransferase class V-fold PLP-dependent enzyme [Steroidobacteraceae bacterium]
MKQSTHFETLAIHAGRPVDPTSGAITPPLVFSTTFERATDGSFPTGFSYGRTDNPGRRALEDCIAALEGGGRAFCFASGSAAVTATFSLLKPGDHLRAPAECYHGTLTQIRTLFATHGIEFSLFEARDAANLEHQLRPNTRLIWVETPSNPLLGVSDIAAIARLAHARGARLAIDSTFATPLAQRPLDLGADLVVHSTTKYFGGHSDVTGGAVIVRDAELAKELVNRQVLGGAVPSPFDCWLIRRSIATLPIRFRAQSETAGRVAEYLAKSPRVEKVYYPGLPTHATHELARRQMRYHGAIVSFCVPGAASEALSMAARLQLFTRATSLGGIESLVEHRASIEGPTTRTPQNLLRLSIGLEHVEDLIADLAQALGHV